MIKLEINRLYIRQCGTNCYLIKDNNLAAVIDPGADECKILESIGNYKLEKIILTHGHFDHTGAVSALKDKTGARVFINPKDEIMLHDANKSLYAAVNGTFKGFKTSDADEYFKDKIDICGNTFEVINTPGHSPGSVCLLGDKILFSGDTLFKESIGRYDCGSYEDIMNSLDILMKLDDDVKVYPGHGFSTTIGSERLDNPYLR
ncbi:MAG: MBL fold metallo-hydrolase [Bacillota bacterium]|nr:MBL fold metallo-hydrolase [Bacillota bacterium]